MHYCGDINTYLAHHGVKGQRWGVRNGPPYPLYNNSAYEKDVEVKKEFVSKLSKELDEEWSYGVLMSDGKRFTDEDDGLENFNWGKDYRTTPVKTLEKEKIGVCWDFVNYQHDQLKKQGIEDSSYLLVMDLSSDNRQRIVTHTFSTFYLDGKEYWLESAMWPKRGVHEIKDYQEAAEEVAGLYTKEKIPYSVYKYNPEGLDAGLTDQEFFDRATDGTLVYDTQRNKH